jgi:hypothetical protein
MGLEGQRGKEVVAVEIVGVAVRGRGDEPKAGVVVLAR